VLRKLCALKILVESPVI